MQFILYFAAQGAFPFLRRNFLGYDWDNFDEKSRVLSNGDFEGVMGGCKAEQVFVRNKGMHDMPLLRTWFFYFCRARLPSSSKKNLFCTWI